MMDDLTREDWRRARAILREVEDVVLAVIDLCGDEPFGPALREQIEFSGWVERSELAELRELLDRLEAKTRSTGKAPGDPPHTTERDDGGRTGVAGHGTPGAST